MGGRAVAKIMRMGKVETPDEWTRLIPKTSNLISNFRQMFTLSNLRNPRQ